MTRSYAPIRVVDSTPSLGLWVREAVPSGFLKPVETAQSWTLSLDTGRHVLVRGKIQEGGEGDVLVLTRETVSSALRRSAAPKRRR